MRRSITITAGVIGLAGTLLAAALFYASATCSSWSPFACHDTDSELTRWAR